MGSVLRNVLKRTPPLPLPPPPPPRSFLASLDKPHLSDPEPASFPLLNPVQRSRLLPNVSSDKAPPPSLRASLQVFPTFPLSFVDYPIGSSVVDRSDGSSDDRTTVWADSVKKKRKRKMNKHKYRKLRKRLRRKTK
ncbi:hypothetical protein Cni_G05297 [Canna indica]|uniref:Small ribosomal subunit protein mS38 n=1 Tax=Canna indica TaxID=4628 RepID=A0AAQ3JYV8_9LILI|nr:hypothetical protein Cni_G05297 [Canna indica]